MESSIDEGLQLGIPHGKRLRGVFHSEVRGYGEESAISPFSSSRFGLFLLKVFHQEARSRFDGGDVASWGVGPAGGLSCGRDGVGTLPVAMLS